MGDTALHALALKTAPFLTRNNGALCSRGSRLLIHSVGRICNYLWRPQLFGIKYVMLHHLSAATSEIYTANFSFCCVLTPTNLWKERHFPSSLFSVLDCSRSWSLSSCSVYVN